MTPDELVEKMAEAVRAYRTQMSITTMSEQMLRVVLQAIKDGEVVEIEWVKDGEVNCRINREFEKWMEDKWAD